MGPLGRVRSKILSVSGDRYFPSFLLFANRSSANSEIPLEVFTISVRFNLRQRLTGIREGRSFFSLHE